jgi:hypothetical protein
MQDCTYLRQYLNKYCNVLQLYSFLSLSEFSKYSKFRYEYVWLRGFNVTNFYF